MKRIVAIIAFMFCGVANAGILQELKDEGVLVLWLDLRSGSLKDLSGNDNDGVPTSIVWNRDGVGFPLGASKITVADSPELQLTTGSIIVLMNLPIQTFDARMVVKRDAGGINYTTFIGAADMKIYDGALVRTVNAALVGRKCAAVNFEDGQIPEGFVNGVSVGAYSGAVAISVNDADITIGNRYGGNSQLLGTLSSVMIINRPLTATEMAAVYGELEAMTWPTKAWGRALGVYGPELVIDGDMEAAGVGAWTSVGAALSKQPGNVLSGNQTLHNAYSASYPYAHQSVLTNGTVYKFHGWAHGDGTYAPYVYLGLTQAWSGTNLATWQLLDHIGTADGPQARLRCSATAAGYCEFDNISVREVIVPETRFKSDWGAYATTVTTAAGGPLANTPFQVSTGSFRMVMDTIQGHTVKAIECVTAGIIYLDESLLHQGPEQRSYGTWTFYLSHADASTTNVHFISSDAVGTAGYRLTITATEQIQLYEVGIGEKFITAADYVSAGYHKYTITRRQRDGLFNVYMDNTFVDTATDNSTTTSAFWLWDLDAGDRGSWSNLTGDMCIMKQDGVNP